jgi:hypothetical protein
MDELDHPTYRSHRNGESYQLNDKPQAGLVAVPAKGSVAKLVEK